RPAVHYVVGAGDRVEFGQVRRIFRVPIVVKKGRTDDQHALGMAESFRYQSGHVLYDGFCPDRDVKSFLNHVYGPVRRLEEDRNFWMYRHVAGECMSQTPCVSRTGLLRRTSPAGSLRNSATLSYAACAPSTVATHRSKKRWPASVRAKARVVRCNKRTPSRFSRAAIRRLRRVFSTPMVRAAAENPPYWTTEAKK